MVRAVGHCPSFHSRNMIQDRMSQWASVYHQPTFFRSSLSAFGTGPDSMRHLKFSLLNVSVNLWISIHQITDGLSFMNNVSMNINQMTTISFCAHT